MIYYESMRKGARGEESGDRSGETANASEAEVNAVRHDYCRAGDVSARLFGVGFIRLKVSDIGYRDEWALSRMGGSCQNGIRL